MDENMRGQALHINHTPIALFLKLAAPIIVYDCPVANQRLVRNTALILQERKPFFQRFPALFLNANRL